MSATVLVQVSSVANFEAFASYFGVVSKDGNTGGIGNCLNHLIVE